MLRLQEDEHQRIARELHNGPFQMLIAAAGSVALLQQSTDRLGKHKQRALIDLTSLIDVCSRDLCTLSRLMYPPMLEPKVCGRPSSITWTVSPNAAGSKPS